MIDKYAKLLSSRLDDLHETLLTVKSTGKLAAQNVREKAGAELDEIQTKVDEVEAYLKEFYRKLPEVNSNRSFSHRYVEWFVRLFEQVLPGGLVLTTVPRWYAKVCGMPDSAYTKGKTVGYHVGHLVADALPAVVAGVAVGIIALNV